MLNVINYYERLVIDRLWKLSETSEESFSRAFLEDVACLALNKLPPCYIRNPIDKGINVNDRQYHEINTSVETAIADAMRLVRSRPRLDRED